MNSEKFKDSSCPNYEQFCESITSDYMRGMVKAVVAKKDTISDLLLAHFDSDITPESPELLKYIN